MKTTFSAADRKGWMSLLATADEARLTELWRGCGVDPVCEWLRPPEAGGVMMRGRMGGTGAPFNLGEITVTRCAVSLDDGTVGHGYVQGRSKAKAAMAAKIDALMQTSAAAGVRKAVLEPLAEERQAKKSARAAKAAATKVEFFTMVRGED
ncbi:phosphonate C-P lyase system protein PhnG [Leisingera aquaemixtae]|uniref:phosphonate C-P lyase system protein PhnG n=1 Tax=Leisingera aquaemixtae TaxID=1396826 RepID=UPI0021A2608F|nr:phosphonate C-P lyase system protein PhnG [Leisingera aquaemixtae]UWQ25325.1 phosphonate C-P lyase system protein PhnG [Leisingera aquaemixtae]UWQ37853.1 phosphonate C-P lyase system protein PhnG [Leisingera aquaemixtae]UWQ46218.1 phosphonate C-P lyase system protein PhnG [Leisingera aquaemixtae]